MANPAKSAARASSFGPFAQAPNHQVMSGFPNYFSTVDATPGTPLLSPLLAVSLTVPQKITIPAAAVQLIIKTDAKLRISEDPLMAAYDTIAPGAQDTYPCTSPNFDNVVSGTGAIYIRSDATTNANVSFKFICI